MNLSKHFKLEEFTKSQLSVRHGIINKPGSGEIKNLENLCYEVLEPVRAHFDKPITITSGFRCLELNRKLGSSDQSAHVSGCACDFEIAGVPNIKVAYWLINNVDFDQCILEFYKPNDGQAGWIHVAFKEGNNRKQVLTYDGNSYSNGLPDMKWEKGVVVE